MDVAKSELRQFLTRATKNAQCANSARIPYGGFSQILSQLDLDEELYVCGVHEEKF